MRRASRTKHHSFRIASKCLGQKGLVAMAAAKMSRSLLRFGHKSRGIVYSAPICPASQVLRRNARHIATYTAPYQASQISLLKSAVDTSSATFSENARNMDELVKKLTSLHEQASLGGTAKAREKHISRGKMLVREYVRSCKTHF